MRNLSEESVLREPDYREMQEAMTPAPSDVISVSFHGLPGKPENMEFQELLDIVKDLKNQRTKRDGFRSNVIELQGCHSGATQAYHPIDALKGWWEALQKGSEAEPPVVSGLSTVAGKVARETGSWTGRKQFAASQSAQNA